MRTPKVLAFLLPATLILLISCHPVSSSRHIVRGPLLGRDGIAVAAQPNGLLLERKLPRHPETVAVAGSSLPDCWHACVSCSPCHLVMVSFVCESLEEAETCPMAYRCMCNSKSYPVP